MPSSWMLFQLPSLIYRTSISVRAAIQVPALTLVKVIGGRFSQGQFSKLVAATAYSGNIKYLRHSLRGSSDQSLQSFNPLQTLSMLIHSPELHLNTFDPLQVVTVAKVKRSIV